MYSGSMSNDKPPRKPQFVGMKPAPDDVVSSYANGIAQRRGARQEAMRAKNPKIPNLAQADSAYDPKKEHLTLDQMAQAQKNVEAVTRGEQKPTLSPHTVAGLSQLNEMANKERAKMTEQSPPEKPQEKTETTGNAEKAEKKGWTQEEANEALARMDDMDLELLMERVRSDVINNEVERKAIEERVEPIDLATGLSTGEFTQVVPINPKVLTVVYRTVSQLESEEFRKLIWNMNAEDARAANLSSERYGLMQTVAAVVQINGEKLPKHYTEDGNGTIHFDEEIFMKKYRRIASYPAPLIHALGTHAFWFDQRVRKLFTTEVAKNG